MIVAVDIGGTKIAAARMDGGRIVEQRFAPSSLHDDYERLPDIVLELTGDWIPSCRAMGIASAGLVTQDTVQLLSRRGQPSIALAAEVEKLCGVRPVIINDASAGALGEYVQGPEQAGDTLLYVTVSTGIGAGIVHKGQLLTSANGLMAHLGHMTVPSRDREPLPCNCGRFDCVEAIASGTAIAARGSAIRGGMLTTRDVFALKGEDPTIAAMLDDAARALAETLTNARALLGVETVLLGGSVGLVPAFRDSVKAAVARNPEPWATSIRPALLGADAELYGAAEAARRSISLHSRGRKPTS